MGRRRNPKKPTNHYPINYVVARPPFREEGESSVWETPQVEGERDQRAREKYERGGGLNVFLYPSYSLAFPLLCMVQLSPLSLPPPHPDVCVSGTSRKTDLLEVKAVLAEKKQGTEKKLTS